MSSTPPPPPPLPGPSPDRGADPRGRGDDDRATTGETSGTVRRSGDRVVAGVAAGLGRRYGIDPVLVRILFVVSSFAAGLGALVYLVLWVALPLVDAPAPVEAGSANQRGPAFWAGAIALTVGGVIALSELPAPRIFVPLALITLGVALWQRPGGTGTAPGQPGEATGATSSEVTGRAQDPTPPGPGDVPGSEPGPAASWQPPPVPGRGRTTPAATAASSSATGTLERPRGQAPGGAPAETWEPVPDVRWWVPPAPRPRPSWLGPITIAVACVVTGGVALLGVAGVLAPDAVDLLAVALAVLAGGLVVGAVRGRAKWLALPALVLTSMLVLAQGVTDLGLELAPTAGVRRVAPDTLDDVGPIRHGAGELVVLLDDTALGAGDGPVDIDLGAGQVQVVVPDDARVHLRVRAGVGEVGVVSLADPDEAGSTTVRRDQLAVGTRLDVDRTLQPDGVVGETIDLDVVVGAGEVEVVRGREAHDAHDASTTDDGDLMVEFDLGEGGSGTIEFDRPEEVRDPTDGPLDPSSEGAN